MLTGCSSAAASECWPVVAGNERLLTSLDGDGNSDILERRQKKHSKSWLEPKTSEYSISEWDPASLYLHNLKMYLWCTMCHGEKPLLDRQCKNIHWVSGTRLLSQQFSWVSIRVYLGTNCPETETRWRRFLLWETLLPVQARCLRQSSSMAEHDTSLSLAQLNITIAHEAFKISCKYCFKYSQKHAVDA